MGLKPLVAGDGKEGLRTLRRGGTFRFPYYALIPNRGPPEAGVFWL